MGNFFNKIISFCDDCMRIQDENFEFYYNRLSDRYSYQGMNDQNINSLYNNDKKYILIKRSLSTIHESIENTTRSSRNISPYSTGSCKSENSQVSPLFCYSPERLQKKEFVIELKKK
jgi:hypothetical protein